MTRRSIFLWFPFLNSRESNNPNFPESFPYSSNEIITSHHLGHSRYSTDVCTIKFPVEFPMEFSLPLTNSH